MKAVYSSVGGSVLVLVVTGLKLLFVLPAGGVGLPPGGVAYPALLEPP
jgi:hypothetical protein